MNGRTQSICDWAEDAPDAIWLARRASDEAQCLVQVRRGKRGPFPEEKQRPNRALFPENETLDPANLEPLACMPTSFAAKLEAFRAYCAMEAAKPVDVLRPASVKPKSRFKGVKACLRRKGAVLYSSLCVRAVGGAVGANKVAI
jgi:hypothetical protein